MVLIDMDRLRKELMAKGDIPIHEVFNTIWNQPIVNISQPKVGKWILTDVEGNRIWHCSCSECGKDPQDYIGGSENWWLIKNKLPKYCPKCGSYNGGEQNDK